VDYQGIGEDPDFGQFVSSLAGLNTSCLSRNATYATFMNAYNALAIKVHPHMSASDALLLKPVGE